MHRRSVVAANEIAIGIVARFLCLPHQAAIGAIGAAAFRISYQQIEEMRTSGAMHPALDQISVIAAALESCVSSGEGISGVLVY